MDNTIMKMSHNGEDGMLLDGGAFDHVCGTDMHKYLEDIYEADEPIRCTTGGGKITMTKKGRLEKGGVTVNDIWINDYMPGTVISEGKLTEEGWESHGEKGMKTLRDPKGNVIKLKKRNTL